MKNRLRLAILLGLLSLAASGCGDQAAPPATGDAAPVEEKGESGTTPVAPPATAD